MTGDTLRARARELQREGERIERSIPAATRHIPQVVEAQDWARRARRLLDEFAAHTLGEDLR